MHSYKHIYNDINNYKQYVIRANSPYINVSQAGIPRQQLILSYEPEVAAIFCKEMKFQLSETGDLDAFNTGARVMVIDLGGMVLAMTFSAFICSPFLFFLNLRV